MNPNLKDNEIDVFLYGNEATVCTIVVDGSID